MTRTVLAIPFYGNETLLQNFIDYFKQFPAERNVFEEVLIIGDKPDGDNTFLSEECAKNNFRFFKNDSNLGFVASANLAFKYSKDTQSNLMLVNSDVRPHKGCFAEMLAVLNSDDRVSTVCPRTNDGSIANFYPWPVAVDDLEKELKFIDDFEASKTTSPRLTYSPTSVGFCLLINKVCINEFGFFDPVYGLGYEEENDLCMRYSQYGYRSIIANHALAFHIHGASFTEKYGSKSREELRRLNYSLLLKRYPYYESKIAEFAQSVNYRAYYNITGALWDNAILIDIRGIGFAFNGTSEITIRYIKELLSKGVYLDICCTREEYLFYELDRLPNNKNFIYPSRYYKTGIKIGQPFDIESLKTIPEFCFKSILVFQDTIAYDCQYLSSELLEVMWQSINFLYSDVIFISEYSKSIYEARFGRPLNSRVVLHSTDIKDYFPKEEYTKSRRKGNFILVVGNKYKHKGIEVVLPVLKNIDCRFVVLGESEARSGNLEIMESGIIPDSVMAELYSECLGVVYPSYYEGFGLPIMIALANQKKIICRRAKPYEEIARKLPEDIKRNIIFYDTPEEFVDLVEELCFVESSDASNSSANEQERHFAHGWDRCSSLLMEYMKSGHTISYSFLYTKQLMIKQLEIDCATSRLPIRKKIDTTILSLFGQRIHSLFRRVHRDYVVKIRNKWFKCWRI